MHARFGEFLVDFFGDRGSRSILVPGDGEVGWGWGGDCASWQGELGYGGSARQEKMGNASLTHPTVAYLSYVCWPRPICNPSNARHSGPAHGYNVSGDNFENWRYRNRSDQAEVSMAATYGERWVNLGSLGEGAQGNIFRVSESRDERSQQFALKRLKRRERSDRFFQEIAALKNINHPNVIQIIDHSRIESPNKDGFPYYFVMPIAENGNLKSRVGLYKDNLDGVVEVAVGLSKAIRAAHHAGYIHRDLKPENVLFDKTDHHPWLSDFGICHNLESDRITKIGDVMGPRGFTAPELESGQNDTIEPSCDIYSLGKLIYYMVTGGTIIFREQFDSSFRSFGSKGERYRLMQILLSRMISPLANRITNIDDVLLELQRIQEWEQKAHTLALAEDVLALINKTQQSSIDAIRIRSENEKIQNDRALILDTTANSICDWLLLELEKLKALMSRSGSYDINIQDVMWNKNRYFGTNDYIAISGLEFVFLDHARIIPTVNNLKFFICKKSAPQIMVGNHIHPIKSVEPEMALIPYFQEGDNHNMQFGTGLCGFIKDKVKVEDMSRTASARAGRGYHSLTEPLIAKTFVGHPINLIVEFKASEWPSVLDQVSYIFSKSVSVAIEHSASDSRSTGP